MMAAPIRIRGIGNIIEENAEHHSPQIQRGNAAVLTSRRAHLQSARNHQMRGAGNHPEQ